MDVLPSTKIAACFFGSVEDGSISLMGHAQAEEHHCAFKNRKSNSPMPMIFGSE
jgi:hypothetical protein